MLFYHAFYISKFIRKTLDKLVLLFKLIYCETLGSFGLLVLQLFERLQAPFCSY